MIEAENVTPGLAQLSDGLAAVLPEHTFKEQ